MLNKKLEYKKENFRLLAFIISKASSGSLFTKLLKDAGWNIGTTVSEQWQISKKTKEEYLFDEFVKIAENGRSDILDFVVEKTIKKDFIYFKKGDKNYKFPTQQLSDLKRKMKIDKESPKKKSIKIFNERKLHKSVIFCSKELFLSGHYSQSIFEACKLLNKRVQEKSEKTELDGKTLMLNVFSVNNPILKLNNNRSRSEKDEQEGFMHLFAGTMHGIRNPKGHEIVNLKDPIRALEYLGFLSLLFRKIDEAKIIKE